MIYSFYRHETLKHRSITVRPYGPALLMIKDVSAPFFPSFKIKIKI